MNKRKKLFNTKVIHSGHREDKETGAVMPPIHLSSTFKQSSPGDFKYEYSRTGNPTRAALETSISTLEGGEFGRAFASGMAAEDTILRLLSPGDHIVMGNDAYGGTFRLISKVLARFGINWTAVDLSDLIETQAALNLSQEEEN